MIDAAITIIILLGWGLVFAGFEEERKECPVSWRWFFLSIVKHAAFLALAIVAFVWIVWGIFGRRW